MRLVILMRLMRLMRPETHSETNVSFFLVSVVRFECVLLTSENCTIFVCKVIVKFVGHQKITNFHSQSTQSFVFFFLTNKGRKNGQSTSTIYSLLNFAGLLFLFFVNFFLAEFVYQRKLFLKEN